MGKKKKKHRSRKKLAQAPSLTGKAGAHLSAGRFRQAVDAYKVLYKTDPESFSAPLKAAYEGLYRQRLEKNLLEEAAMVIDQLEKITGTSAFPERIALHLNREEYSKAADASANVLSDPNAVSGTVANAAADALVVAFDPVPAENALPAEVRSDLHRIRSALESVAAGSRRDALARIKPIGIRSIFVSWKWLVKGLCAFYGQEDEKAAAAFEKIAPDTAPAAAAAPYLRLLQKDRWQDTDAKDTELMTDVCVVAGYETVAAALARAEYLWTVKRFRDSHAHLRNTMKGFPTCSRGLERSLTELYYNTSFEMPPKKALKYVEHLMRSAFAGKADNTADQIWALRSLALFNEEHADFDPLILEQWEKFIDLYQSLNGDSPRVRSLVYGRLGDLFSHEMPDDNPFSFFFFHRRRKAPNLRNVELARYSYQESVKADPESIQPQLARVAFFEKVGDSPRVNRLLDRLIRQFPDEKEVLFKAGARCSERKAFTKAMKYLERALELDPMDKGLRESFMVTCIRAALRYVDKKNPGKARALLPRALEWSDAHSDDFNRGPAYLYARWTAMERILGRDADARQLWAQAVAHRQGSELKLHFFYWIIARSYGVAPRLLKETEAFVDNALKGAFWADTALDCIATLQYANLLPGSFTELPQKTARVKRYLARGAAVEVTRQQAEAFVNFALSDGCNRPDIAQAYVRRMLHQNPDDALFRYYRYLARSQVMRRHRRIDNEMQELKAILRLAREQKEATVALAVQKLLRAKEPMPPFSGIGEDPFFDIDDDLEDEGLEVEDDDFFPFFSPPPKTKKPKRKNRKQKSEPRGPQQLNLF